MPATSIELQQGALRLALRPDLGGCLAGLWRAGEPVLRSTEPLELTGVRQSACFSLVPYSNRIGYRKFTWRGQHYQTAPNFDDSPHSLHGVGWQRAFQIEAADERCARLRYRHVPDEHWPFAFDVVQQVALDDDLLALDLVLTNSDDRDQPAGLGFHPYFPLRSQSRLHAAVTGRFVPDARQLPQRREDVLGLHADVASLELDHCYDRWDGTAHIVDERFSLRLTADLTCLVVFTPTARGFFCVEPVSHVTNAVQAADPAALGLRALAPGQTLRAAMRLEIGPG